MQLLSGELSLLSSPTEDAQQGKNLVFVFVFPSAGTHMQVENPTKQNIKAGYHHLLR